AGFVGRGMLNAAVCGEVFASPSVDAVLAGILAVTGEAGCLLIVKNYTGDRLNFGLAAERAKALGKKVEMVVVADDVALPDIPQPRGVAGTLFVHKIAGHAAEQGASLADVAALARAVAEKTASYGVSLSSCDVPGTEQEQRIPEGHAELGLGIHGEPGIRTTPFDDAASVAKTVMESLHSVVGDGNYVMLLNNLGATTPLEMSVVANAILDGQYGSMIRSVIGPAPLMTSLNMHGFSVSLLPAESSWVEALEGQVEPADWPGINTSGPIKTQALPAGLERQAVAASSNEAAASFLRSSCDDFLSMEADLNALDAKIGDGDTGSTLSAAARALKESVDELPLADQTELLRALSDRLSATMGGSSGVLLAILFSAAADASSTGASLPQALWAGLQKMQEYGGAEPGHRTMIDALSPALKTLVDGKSLADAAAAARQGADATASMSLSRAGRSAYLSADALNGVTDPGAEGVARYFAALAERDS
nr:dihydroxyacetone kinase subunit DhaK [Granulosicoccus sp.]